MHFVAILTVVAAAWLIRDRFKLSAKKWSERWYQALFLFLFPPLLLITTAAAVLYMGCHGAMLGVKAGSFGCLVAATLLIFSSCCLFKLAYQSDRALRRLNNCSQHTVGQTTARILETEIPYSARIGFWDSQLIVSTGLIAVLDEVHLAAVIAHEQAHHHYRDTFWFFWLGWIRLFTCWLPQTELLWQELLLLRELRADRKAAETVDFLLLAESLLTVAKSPLESTPNCYVGLNDFRLGDRLNERIDSLLSSGESVPASRWYDWSWLCLVLLPLLTIPLHY